MIDCEDTAQVAAEVERIIERLDERLREDPAGTLDALRKIIEDGDVEETCEASADTGCSIRE